MALGDGASDGWHERMNVVSSREDLARFSALDIDFEAIGLMEPGVPQEPYFCDPVGGEPVGRVGCDGVHFILLPGDERVFCVDPAMGEPGSYVLPVAENFRQFLSFVLFCGDANPISQIWWMDEGRFRDFLKEESERSWEGMEDFLERKKAALAAIAAAFGIEPADPYGKVKALQASFDPACLRFSEEYYDTLGLDSPEQEEI